MAQKTKLQKWLEYFECGDTRKVGETPKFKELLKGLGRDFKGPARYFFSSEKLHIVDQKSVYGYILEKGSIACISATLLH